MKTRIVWLLALAAICCSAQNNPAQDNKDDIIQKLISRVEALEREVAALKQPAAAAVTPEPAAPPQPKVAPTVAAETASQDQRFEDRFTFRGFADGGFLRNVEGDSTKRFALGEVDLFATARISPRLSALVEVVLETDNQVFVNQLPVNVERLLLQYRQNDYFNLGMGSYRTAIGFYSTAYLRGSWLQTALSRPRVFAFEDDGGFLPLHNVGLSANGRIPSGPVGLHYVAEVGSSRNYAQPGRTGLDLEQNGAVNVALYAQPPSILGLLLGGSFYRDTFSPWPGVKFDRSVWAAHVVYRAHRIEFLNEGVLARIRNAANGNGSMLGFYSQGAYRLGSNWNPYGRFEYGNVYGRGELLLPAQQYVPWRTIVTGGVRYDLTESVAFKVELGRETDRYRSPWIRAAAQIAFTF